MSYYCELKMKVNKGTPEDINAILGYLNGLANENSNDHEAFKIDQSPVSREFAVLFFGDYSKQYTGKKEDSVYIIFNMHWEKKEFVLPMTTKTKRWRLLYSTDGSTDESFDESKALLVESESYMAEGRSISVLLLNS